MPEITDTIHINRPVEVIFDYLTDLDTLPVRIPSAQEAAMISGEDMRVGTRYLVSSRMRGRITEIEYEVIEYEENRAYGTRIIGGGQPFQEHYQLEEKENGTRVTLVANGEMSNLTKIFSHSFKRLLKKQVGKDLERLKSLLESQQD
jgi:carbon monoxide dehydrogenase subunit G